MQLKKVRKGENEITKSLSFDEGRKYFPANTAIGTAGFKI